MSAQSPRREYVVPNDNYEPFKGSRSYAIGILDGRRQPGETQGRYRRHGRTDRNKLGNGNRPECS